MRLGRTWVNMFHDFSDNQCGGDQGSLTSELVCTLRLENHTPYVNASTAIKSYDCQKNNPRQSRKSNILNS